MIIDGTWMDIWADLQKEALGEEIPRNYRIPFRNDRTYVPLQTTRVPAQRKSCIDGFTIVI